MLLVRELRKRDRHETLDNLRDPDLVREGKTSTSRAVRPSPNNNSGRKLDGEIVSDQDDLSDLWG